MTHLTVPSILRHRQNALGLLKINASISLLLAAIACSPTLPAPTPSSAKPTHLQASIIHEGQVDCFSAEWMNAQPKRPTCELSAVEILNNRIFFANDKSILGPGRSALMWFDSSTSPLRGPPTAYFPKSPLQNARKWEAMAKVFNTPIIVGSTAFDRIKPDGNYNSYNTLAAWDATNPSAVQIINSSTQNGFISSVSLRSRFKEALQSNEHPDGPNYFKVEAMAILPNSQILFGIRELGESYKEFSYRRTIVAGTLTGTFPNLSVQGPLKRIFDFDPPANFNQGFPVGISSLAFDSQRNGLWMLTSYEKGSTDEGLGGYLWFIELKQLEAADAQPQLVYQPNGTPLQFSHKSEGLSVQENGNLLIIHDDDRVTGRANITNPATQFTRALHQSHYSVVAIH